MTEKELVRRIIDFGFIIKARLYSEETALLRSIMNILIMEAEDVLEDMTVKESETIEEITEQKLSSM